MRQYLVVVVFVCCTACFPDVHVGASQGIPPVDGGADFDIAGLQCGTPIPVDGFTATTTRVDGGCKIAFDQDVTIMQVEDYDRIKDLTGASNLLKAVELKITKLVLSDPTTGEVLDLQTRVTQAQLFLNGQLLADKTTLMRLPRTVRLQGATLTELKKQFEARQPIVAHVSAVVVVPDTPAPPQRLHVDYDAQPELVLGL